MEERKTYEAPEMEMILVDVVVDTINESQCENLFPVDKCDEYTCAGDTCSDDWG